MIQINEHVYQIENLKVGQVFLIVEKEDFTLIDTGMIGDYHKIVKQLLELELTIGDIKNIIITHSHFDHVANLKKICKLSKAEIFAHEMEIPKIASKIGNCEVQSVKNEDKIDVLDGLSVIHVPGHTSGNIALYNTKYRLLFAGDCIFNDKQPSFPSNKFNQDTTRFLKEVQVLKNFDVDIICPGHGATIASKGNSTILELLKK